MLLMRTNQSICQKSNRYQIGQCVVSVYSSSGTDHKRWAAMRIPKLTLCQLDTPIKFGSKMEDWQDSLGSGSNNDNGRD